MAFAFRFLPTFEGVGFDLLMGLGFLTLAGILVFTLVQVALLWRCLRRLLVATH